MAVSLSIKDVPEELAAGLRERAARHHRSLQRELMALVEAAVADTARTAREPEASYRVPASARPAATSALRSRTAWMSRIAASPRLTMAMRRNMKGILHGSARL